MFNEAEKRRILRVAMRKQMLRQRGLIYRDFGDPGLVYRVIQEHTGNPRLRKEIAAKLRVAYDKVWPT